MNDNVYYMQTQYDKYMESLNNSIADRYNNILNKVIDNMLNEREILKQSKFGILPEQYETGKLTPQFMKYHFPSLADSVHHELGQAERGHKA
jgi:hypothetical protein